MAFISARVMPFKISLFSLLVVIDLLLLCVKCKYRLLEKHNIHSQLHTHNTKCKHSIKH